MYLVVDTNAIQTLGDHQVGSHNGLTGAVITWHILYRGSPSKKVEGLYSVGTWKVYRFAVSRGTRFPVVIDNHIASVRRPDSLSFNKFMN